MYDLTKFNGIIDKAIEDLTKIKIKEKKPREFWLTNDNSVVKCWEIWEVKPKRLKNFLEVIHLREVIE